MRNSLLPNIEAAYFMFGKLRNIFSKKETVNKQLTAIVMPTIETYIDDQWEKTIGIDTPLFQGIEEVVHSQRFKVLIILHEYSMKDNECKIDISCKIENELGEDTDFEKYSYSMQEQTGGEQTFRMPQELPAFQFQSHHLLGSYQVCIQLYDHVSKLNTVIRKPIQLVSPNYISKAVCEEELNVWQHNYYQNPKPLELIGSFEQSLRFLPEDVGALLNLIFYVEALKLSPFLAKEIVRKLSDNFEDKNDRIWFMLLLGNSGINLEQFSASFSDDDISILKETESESMPNPLFIEHLQEPLEMDILWCKFFANGKYENIVKIASVLHYKKYKKVENQSDEEILKTAMYDACLWSLKSNRMTHKFVAIYCIYILNNEALAKGIEDELLEVIGK